MCFTQVQRFIWAKKNFGVRCTLRPIFTVATQVQVQAQQFLLHRENGFDEGIRKSTITSTRIKIFRFSLCLRLCSRLRCNKWNCNTAQAQHKLTRMLTSRGYVSPVKSLDPDLIPRVVGMILLGAVLASNFVFIWVIPAHCLRLRLYFSLC